MHDHTEDDFEESPDKKEPQSPSRGKDEMNLAEFPFASLTRRPSNEPIVYQDQRRRQKWIASGTMDLGSPTEFDERVYIALMAITAEQDFADRKVTFSVGQIIRVMGLHKSKRTYADIEDALKRLVGVTIYSEETFWDNEKKRTINTSKAFHLIDEYWLRYQEHDEEVKLEEGVAGYIVWGKRIWQSFKSNYIKNLDLELFYRLQSPLSRRLYRLLDKRMWSHQEYEFDIFDLAAKLGMARYQYPAKVREKLQPAINELIEEGFLASAAIVKVKGYTRIRFVRAAPRALTGSGESSQPRPAAASSGGEPVANPERYQLTFEALVEHGITRKVAAELAAKYDPDYISQKIRYMLYLEEQGGKRLRSPRGWLRRAIEEDFGPPEGFGIAGATAAAELLFSSEERRATLTWREWVRMTHEVPPTLVLLSEELQAALKLQMTEATYQATVANILIINILGSGVQLAVPSQSAAMWISNRHKRQFDETLSRLLGREVQVMVDVIEFPDVSDLG